ncbi:nitroreductase family protein [Jatrophihabitans sp.]|uniref:nitroreductase family protein n=1 Tax=Jatrophihabitans sp. TaxID=1932789 RepID=UPI0030C6B9EF|nr:nitroreductase [Jatrophihabitans sp.]
MTEVLGVDELLTTTRSIRRRLDLQAPVDLSEITAALSTALHAPSGSNEQSWRWIVITDPAVRTRLGALYLEAFHERRARTAPLVATTEAPDDTRLRVMRSAAYLAENIGAAPVLVVPCVRPYMPPHPADTELIRATLYASIYPAVWNFQLALRTRGYGTCLTTLHLMRHAEAAELLGIPAGWTQSCLLPVARIKGENRFNAAERAPLDSVMSVDRF